MPIACLSTYGLTRSLSNTAPMLASAHKRHGMRPVQHMSSSPFQDTNLQRQNQHAMLRLLGVRGRRIRDSPLHTVYRHAMREVQYVRFGHIYIDALLKAGADGVRPAHRMQGRSVRDAGANIKLRSSLHGPDVMQGQRVRTEPRRYV